jgi:single-strand DNA-binding protein
MAGLNKVMIIGNLGGDPEVRQAGDAKVANFNVAVTERFKDRQGQQQERTEWVTVVVWRALADIAQQYLRKGSPVFVEGKLQTRSWDDQNGQKRYKTEVVANNFQMLGGRRDDSNGGGFGGGQSSGGYGDNSGGNSGGFGGNSGNNGGFGGNNPGSNQDAGGFGGADTEDDLPF